MTCVVVRLRPNPSTHTLINPESVWPLEPDLQKSNQYVNSVISVKSVTTPFTQKPELGAFQSCSPYLWYEIQIVYDEGEKHRRDAEWGLSSSYIFSTAIRRTCHPGSPSLPPSSPFLTHNTQIHAYNQLWKYFSNVKCPEATEATQLSPVGGRSEERSALYLPCWQTSLKSTGCLSAVKAVAPHEYNPITPEGEGQQYNRGFLPVQAEPLTLNTSQRHKCLLYSLWCPKNPKAKDRKEGETVELQYNGRGDGRMGR